MQKRAVTANMQIKARVITIAAAMTALSAVVLYVASIMPVEKLGLIAVTTLFGIAAVIEGKLKAGLFVYVGTVLLSVLFLQNKAILLSYVFLFGYYPLIKSLAERLKNKVFSWLLKLAVFNLALSIQWFLFGQLIFTQSVQQLGTPLVYVAGNVAFVLFDFGLTRLIGFYIGRISKQLKKSKS